MEGGRVPLSSGFREWFGGLTLCRQRYYLARLLSNLSPVAAYLVSGCRGCSDGCWTFEELLDTYAAVVELGTVFQRALRELEGQRQRLLVRLFRRRARELLYLEREVCFVSQVMELFKQSLREALLTRRAIFCEGGSASVFETDR